MPKALIFGGAGSIGSELYRQLVKDHVVMAFDIDETRLFDLHEEYRLKGYSVEFTIGDIRNRERVMDVVRSFAPDVIYHAAALKHVTPHEFDPSEAIHTNVNGTLNILDAAKRELTPQLVFVSTDKAVNQRCVMGTTKRLGEIMTTNAGYVAVRFGNVMHSRGSVLEIWERQFEAGEPLTITDERMKRYTMTIPEACKLLITASKRKSGLLIMDMGEPVSIMDMMREFLEQKGTPHYPYKVIGIRPGEALEEHLFTEEEAKRVIKEDNFYVI